MLDENLPAFFLKPSSNGVKHQRDFYLSHHGSDPEPSYTLVNTDPASAVPTHKNCYAAALYDAYNLDVLFGEALVRPDWTQPSLSAEELRRAGGVAPPPQPILPAEFTLQLYNPEQQIRVGVHQPKWSGTDSYEFSLPQNTFRTPSASNIDRGQSDPATLSVTPRINFVWRKESKLSKDLTCFMTGRSTDAVDPKKKNNRKDPDIAVGLWRSLRELTIYEPNLSRIDIEDPKGLEVVLLLSAVVIKDIYYGSKEQIPELFNLSDPSAVSGGGGGRKGSGGRGGLSPQNATAAAVPPPPDPRSQWQLEAETARLRATADAEAKEERRRRKEKEKADEAERKRLQKMVQDEERESRRRQQAEVDQETERLRRQYGLSPPPAVPPRTSRSSDGRYRQSDSGPSTGSAMMSGANSEYYGSATGGLMVPPNRPPPRKKNFFGLRDLDDEGSGRQNLKKKSSSLW